MTAPVVYQWSGIQVRALRHAKRMSTREFARHLGVSGRIVTKWESLGANITPGPFNQRSLDICLARCTPEEQARFEAWRDRPLGDLDDPDQPVWYERPDMRVALARRDIATVFRLLQKSGISQRRIAYMTEQSQSEISEIIAGRRVVSYDLLERICDGLGVPRAYMGLGYDEESAILARNGYTP